MNLGVLALIGLYQGPLDKAILTFNENSLFSTPAGICQHQTTQEDIKRFQRQAQGEGVRERIPGMCFGNPENEQSRATDAAFSGPLPASVEEQVLLLRAQNQRAQLVGSGDDV